MNTNTTSLKGNSFSETLAMIRLGHIDAPVTVLSVDLDHDLITVDHGDVDVLDHPVRDSLAYDHYTSAGDMANVMTETMADYGSGFACVWFAGECVHFSHIDAVDPWTARTGGTGQNN